MQTGNEIVTKRNPLSQKETGDLLQLIAVVRVDIGNLMAPRCPSRLVSEFEISRSESLRALEMLVSELNRLAEMLREPQAEEVVA